MNISVKLDTKSIQAAILKLNEISEKLNEGLKQTVEILMNEGTEIAQAAYGGMAEAVGMPESDTVATISAVGGDEAIIAEFGAGNAVIPSLFENPPETPIYPGSYSLLKGSKEYYYTGKWHFAGAEYTEIPARHGLLNARNYILENGANIAQEVIQLD